MDILNIEIITKLLLAVVLGGAIGIERNMAGKAAGLRTYSLVAMGSALFVIISDLASSFYPYATSFDPLRMASQVVVGIGFLGAGMIIFHNNKVEGLTTAAGMWVAAGIGMAAGFGLYSVAVLVAALTVFIFTVMWLLEKFVFGEQGGQ